MNIKEIILKIKKLGIKEGKELLKDSGLTNEELLKFIADVNEVIENTAIRYIKQSVKFNLIDKTSGDYYKSMLGKGENIDYQDLYEILTRLYKYHHESSKYILQFEDYTIDINYNNLSDTPTNYTIMKIITSVINSNEFLDITDLS